MMCQQGGVGFRMHLVPQQRVMPRTLSLLRAVDDGSGVISCCQWRKVTDSDQGLVIPSLGQLVSIYGRLSEFRGNRQIKVILIGIQEKEQSFFNLVSIFIEVCEVSQV